MAVRRPLGLRQSCNAGSSSPSKEPAARWGSQVITSIDIAIVGAGPYALSLAAHLAVRRVSHRAFGRPLETWRRHMPAGMSLKSDGFASSLSAPTPSATLGDYCEAQGLPYHDTDLPVPLATFVRYAM